MYISYDNVFLRLFSREYVFDDFSRFVVFLHALVVALVKALLEPDEYCAQIPLHVLICSVIRDVDIELIISIEVLHGPAHIEGNAVEAGRGVVLSVTGVGQEIATALFLAFSFK